MHLLRGARLARFSDLLEDGEALSSRPETGPPQELSGRFAFGSHLEMKIAFNYSRRTMRHSIVVAVLCAVLCGACGSPGRAPSGRLSVVASFYPFVYAVERVGGSHVAVGNLTPPGAEPHDIELRPGDVTRLRGAQLLVYMSGRFQPAVEDAVHEARRALDLRSFVDLNRASEETQGAPDPHFWLDPLRMMRAVDAIAERLIVIDPNRATDYRAGRDALDADLRALDGDYRRGLASCARHEIVTAHAAFGYQAQRYRLAQIPIAGVDPEVEPTPRHLADVVTLVRRYHVTTVFTETLVSPKVAETIAREANVRTAVLDPIEGVKSGSGDTYLSVMRRNLRALRGALGCT
jgi:zinc transport system substrate-binding protein